MTDITLEGLSAEEAQRLQAQYGKNELVSLKKDGFFKKTLHVLAEPMFLLLLAAAVIYFILGEPRDGAIMLVFVLGVIGIELLQSWKTDRTLNALKDLSAPQSMVLRDGKEIQIASADLVPGDIMLVCEGLKLPADGLILRCNDLCVDESSLTGEAEGVWKIPVDDASASDNMPPSGDYWRKDCCYAGTLVTQGSAALRVEKIGASTEYGKIGSHVAAAPESSTPLQQQTNSLVNRCAGIAAALFVLVAAVTWFNIPDHSFWDRLIESILSGITLTMAMIPEEFPVILTVFLSMGAWRLAKKKSLVRRLPSVETLGAISVLCVDKTGTLTMNQMRVQQTWVFDGDEDILCEMMGLACETEAYDPMEQAMLDYCETISISKDHLFGGTLLSEYAFTNELKMMGHIWRHEEEILIAAKGSPERILTICDLTKQERGSAEEKIRELSEQGLRVIAVAMTKLAGESEIPASLTDCSLTFLGLVGLADPLRDTVKDDIALCNRAGIRVVMITGDNGITAGAIAKQIGMPHTDNIITGDMLERMSDEELRKKVKKISIFSRVIPEHKMRIVKAFKENGEIVAMTGDGVNDAPALKYADIGIAMGKRGSEVSREAADLILMDDNFSTIVDTVKDGRRIYDNLRKAVGYVFSIHIPIALASLLAPLLGIDPAGLLLLPLHVVLLELVIDPTCSVVLERQPAETDLMERRPRDPKEKLLTASTLLKSVAQGLMIFLASFGAYFYALSQNPEQAPAARSMGLTVLILSNLFLVQINSSSWDSIFFSVKSLIKDKVMWAANILTLLGLLVLLYAPFGGFLKLAPLRLGQFACAAGLAAASVLWYELVKLVRKLRLSRKPAKKR